MLVISCKINFFSPSYNLNHGKNRNQKKPLITLIETIDMRLNDNIILHNFFTGQNFALKKM